MREYDKNVISVHLKNYEKIKQIIEKCHRL